MSSTDFVVDVTITAENALQFTFNTPSRIVTMAAGSGVIVSDKTSFIQVRNNIFQTADIEVGELQTVNGVAFTGTHADLLSQVEAMADLSNDTSGGASAGSGVDTWVYKNSNHTALARLTLASNNFSELVISNNVDSIFKTAASDAHDGSKFVFSEDDVVEVKVNMKIDGNTNSNLMRVKLRSKDGNYAIRQAHADTNVQQFGQDISFSFAALHINAGTAAQGFDITISDFVSTADAFVYNIFFTVKKIGTKV